MPSDRAFRRCVISSRCGRRTRRSCTPSSRASPAPSAPSPSTRIRDRSRPTTTSGSESASVSSTGISGRHLEVIIPTNCITLPLRRVTDFLYVGVVTDQRCFGQSQWILGARTDGDRGELIARVPKLVKICSSRHVERLFKEARPGLEYPASGPIRRARSPHVSERSTSRWAGAEAWRRRCAGRTSQRAARSASTFRARSPPRSSSSWWCSKADRIGYGAIPGRGVGYHVHPTRFRSWPSADPVCRSRSPTR